MRKMLFVGLLLLFSSFCFAWLAYAEEASEVTLPFGDIKIVLDPSPDERANGHAIYFYNKTDPSKEFCIGNELLQADTENNQIFYIFQASDKLLYPGHSYVFSAVAFNKETEDVSARSESVALNVKADGSPATFLPEPYVFVLSPDGIAVSQ